MLLFETIKVKDGALQNLFYHQKRMDFAFNNIFEIKNPFQLNNLTIPNEYLNGICKCKFIYSSNNYEIQFSEYKPKIINSLTCVFCDDINYNHKYFDRQNLEYLVGLKANCDDIIIIKNGCIADCSFGNLVFFDGKDLITPSTPLLNGTKRQFYLDNNIIFEKMIRTENLRQYEFVKIINAMIDIENSLEIKDFLNGL